MSLLSRIPWPSHPGASCEERERNSALAGLALCFLLAVGLVVSAMLLASNEDPTVADAAPATGGGGNGTGVGPGFGAGVGRGSALAGDGPGGGTKGERSGSSGSNEGNAPKGQRIGTVAVANAKDGESLVTGDSKEPPKFGFTPDDSPDPIDPPQTAVAVGRPDGSDGEGRAGAGGGGNQGFMGIKSSAKKIVYILDFSASMRDQDDRRDEVLKRELTASIQRLPPDASFQVILFGVGHRIGKQVTGPADRSTMVTHSLVMPPETLVPADPRHRGAATAWVLRQEPDPEGASEPWGAMKRALELRPEAIYLLTDGEFPPGEPDRLAAEVAANNTEAGVEINTIAFATDSDISSLQALAANNKGTYRRVTLKR